MAESRDVLGRAARSPDHEWRYGPDPDEVADVYLPAASTPTDPPRPVVVLVHGGFWRPEYDRTHLRPMAAALADTGYPVLLPEYDRHPGRPDAGLSDLRVAIDRLPDSGLPVARGVALVGHSAGGHHVLVLASEHVPGLRGVLALAPVADLRAAERLDLDEGAVADYLGTSAHHRPDLDPVAASGPQVPVFLLHGADDSLVPLDQSRAYASAHGAPLTVLESAAHFEPIDPLSSAWPAVLGQLARILPIDAPAGIE